MTASITILLPGSIASSHDSTLVPKGTVIYQISPDGAPRQLWASPHDVVYALAWQQNADPRQSGLLVGSGNQGHLYRISLDGTYADLAHLEATDATAFAHGGQQAVRRHQQHRQALSAVARQAPEPATTPPI